LGALTQLRANHGLREILLVFCLIFFRPFFFSSAVDQNRCRRLSYFRQIVLVHLFLPISSDFFDSDFCHLFDFEREREREMSVNPLQSLQSFRRAAAADEIFFRFGFRFRRFRRLFRFLPPRRRRRSSPRSFGPSTLKSAGRWSLRRIQDVLRIWW